MARLIDAAALVKEAGRLWEEMPDGEELSKELMKAINHAPTAELTDEAAIEHLQASGWMQNHDREMSRPRWISVEDRLPEATQPSVKGDIVFSDYVLTCLVYEDGRKWITVDTCRVDRGVWLHEVPGEGCKVTHWMPLPEPPKEDETNDKA